MKLEDLPKKNIYQVPENYFEKLPGRVMQRVTQDSVSKNPFYAFWNLPYLRPALASVMIVICLAVLFLFNRNQAPESSELLASISDKDAMEYLIRMEKLESQDLSLLSQSEQDLSHEFIQASQQDILEEVEQSDLEEHIY